MESGFTKANSNNLPRIDAVMLGRFFASNSDFCSSEFRNVKTSMFIYACIFVEVLSQNSHIYKWLQNNDKGDCIVLFVLDGRPVATGVWISVWTVLTARNPFSEPRYDNQYTLQIHAVNGNYSFSYAYDINCYRYGVCGYNAYTRDALWVRHGFGHKHSPLHDLATFTVKLSPDGWKRYPARLRQFAERRQPYFVKLPFGNFSIQNDLSFGGFGYIDQDHIEDNTQLEMEFYYQPIIEDCDEWFPKAWGRFICLSNIGGFAGVASGMPLFSRGYLIGIGSFSFQRNNESILVFTDLRPYIIDEDICICYFHNGDGNFHGYRHRSHESEWILSQFESMYSKLIPENNLYGIREFDP